MPDHAYRIAIRALSVLASGDYAYGAYTVFDLEGQVEPPFVDIPASPVGLRATAGEREVSLTWRGPSDAFITGWQVRMRTTGGWSRWSAIPGGHPNTRSHTVTDLEHQVRHAFQLRAVSAVGPGDPSDVVYATPESAGPAAPRGFRALAEDGAIVLRWVAPTDSAVTHFEGRGRAESDSSWGHWTRFERNVVTDRIENLTNGMRYHFELRAVSVEGAGRVARTSATPATVPSAPTLSLTAGNTVISAWWTAPADDGGVPVIDYDVQYRARTSGAWTNWPHSGASRDTAIDDLTNGQLYQVQVSARNVQGSSEWSASAEATPNEAATTVPARPTALSASPGSGQVLLTWTLAVEDASITSWDVRYGTGSSSSHGYGSPSELSTDAGARRGVVRGLTNGTTYRLQLRATNSFDSSDWVPTYGLVVTIPSPPAKPTGLAATRAPLSGAADLAWADPDNSDITSYQYRFKRTGGFTAWTTITGSSATTTSHRVTGLVNGTQHTFQIRARSAGGWSPASASALTTPNAPTTEDFLLDTSMRVGYAETFGAAVYFGYARPPWGTLGDLGDSSFDHPDTTETHNVTFFAVRRGSGIAHLTCVAIHPGLTLDQFNAMKFQLRDHVYEGGWWYSNSLERNCHSSVVDLVDDERVSFRIRGPGGSPPGQPEDLTATAGNASVALTWTGPDDDSITAWQYRWKLTGETYSAWANVSTNHETRSTTLSGLKNGQSYTFQLRAKNAVDEGPASLEVTATPITSTAIELSRHLYVFDNGDTDDYDVRLQNVPTADT